MSSPAPRESERGIILVAVLWIVASLSLLVSAFNTSVRTSTSGTGFETALARAAAHADAGIEIAVLRLPQKAQVGGWRADGRQYHTSFADSRLGIRIIDANGRADLNKTDVAIIYGLLARLASSDQQAGVIRDYIIEKRKAAAGPVAPAPSRRTARQAKDKTSKAPAAFVDVSQLRDAPQMSAALYRRLYPFITVYSRDGAINPLTAPRELLLAIPDMTSSDVDRLAALDASSQSEDEIKRVLPAKAQKFLKIGSGPAYTITVSSQSAGLANPLKREVTIMAADQGLAPYYWLAWRPGGF